MENALRDDRKQVLRDYSPFESELLSASIKLSLHKALIKSAVIYACAAWEFA
jgi:hypothetical protein